MKLIITADLHFDIARSIDPAQQIAEEMCSLRADGLMIVGDACGRDLNVLSECLHLFDGFPGRKFFVAGNHDLWVHPGGDSIARLEREIPERCREAGFTPLDVEPAVLEGVGLVGTVGWYDYSYRAMHLEIPLRFYEHKVAPGAAARISRCADLVQDLSDVPDSAMQIGTRWMDGEYIRMAIDDRAFCDRLLNRLRGHLQWAAARADRIVAGIHHIPFRELVVTHENPSWSFANAFMGSELFGELLLEFPQVTHVYTGHTHRGMCCRRGHITCINVGCTYAEKRYEVLELTTSGTGGTSH